MVNAAAAAAGSVYLHTSTTGNRLLMVGESGKRDAGVRSPWCLYDRAFPALFGFARLATAGLRSSMSSHRRETVRYNDGPNQCCLSPSEIDSYSSFILVSKQTNHSNIFFDSTKGQLCNKIATGSSSFLQKLLSKFLGMRARS